MATAHRRYIAIEAMIGAVISGVLSVTFVFLIFGRLQRVPAFGARGLAIDALPQSFMIALMASLVPTLLTRGRVRRGVRTAWGGASTRMPHNVAARAVTIAVIVAVVGGAITALCLSFGPADFTFVPVLIVKTIYGTLLGGCVAAIATRLALADRSM